MNNLAFKKEDLEIDREGIDRSGLAWGPELPLDQSQIMAQNASHPIFTGPVSAIGVTTDEASQRSDTQGGIASGKANGRDLCASSPANSRRSDSQNVLKRTTGYVGIDDDDNGDDDDGDDEGGPIRSSHERVKRQRQAFRTPQGVQESSDIRIGHHSAEPLITIFAKFKKETSGRTMTHIYSRKSTMVFPSGRSWSDYVHKNGQVNPADVTLDPELFPHHMSELPHVKTEQKRQIIAEYLYGILGEGQPASNVEAPTPCPKFQVEPPRYEQRPPFIVGFHKDHPAVPVRAQLRIQSGSRAVALLFKLKDEEVKNSHLRLPKLSVQDTQVKFNPEFARTTIEETRAEILARFLARDNENQDQEVPATPGKHTPRRRQSKVLTPRAHSSKTTPTRPRLELPTGTDESVDECLESLQVTGQHFLTTAFEYGQKLKRREIAYAEKENLLEDQIALGVQAALMGKEDVAKALQTQVEQLEKAKAEDHDRMQKQIEQLTAQLEEARKQSNNSTYVKVSNLQSVTPNPASGSLFLDLKGKMFSQAYTKIPDDHPNTGWYWQNHNDTIVHHEGPLQGKKFTRNQVLQPIVGITVPGRLKDTALRCGGIEYLHYEENGIAKLVQNSESVVQHEGQYYVCWTYLREVQDFKF
ncbi:hypothetical protein ONS96_002251 [Cadophora gregata f. sp. sojae]|nr:hypothetical protein ONS96_002251 [Cadophora gregata f. sp. sojae]